MELFEILMKDAFYVLRSFIKLSGKSILESPAPPSPGQPWDFSRAPSIRSKILVLEQIHFLLQTYGASVLQHFEIFLTAIRQFLSPTLIRSALSGIPAISDLAFDIITDLFVNFKTPFKKENEILMNEIVLNLLDMRNTPVDKKIKLVSCLGRITQEPRVLIEMYLNYDCDPDATENMFEKMVNVAAKILQTRLDSNSANYSEDVNLFLGALVLQSSLIKALHNWCKKPPKPTVTKESQEEGETETESNTQNRFKADPNEFEEIKHRKQLLQEGIRLFNWKIKKGINLLIESECIPSKAPKDIAKFLLANNDVMNKKNIGEYLGEGDAENIAVMHAFVELMDFSNMLFVDALRLFLQSFRLPGEAQKIDRFMLKFAQQYVLFNPSAFANADTAYVLAYSVIMLNTDLHNPQVKKRMTKQEFIRNNRGINDNQDLPESLLTSIYDEILTNEIKMKEEQQVTDQAEAKGQHYKALLI
jgi:brefeldin A-inhibited guanine nucleotide-exchange protein